MKAILLTYDKQCGLAQLLVKSYELLLGEYLPFQFLIPCQNKHAYTDFSSDNVKFIESKTSKIKDSIAVLLDGIDDNEWVFWCIDDRYPVAVEREQLKENS